MSIVVLGLNQRTVPLALLERASIDGDQLPKALHELCCLPSVSEAVVLSTCNRTEVIVIAERFHGAYADVRDFFGELTGIGPDQIANLLHSFHDVDAVDYLFKVASGLDSAVLGEHEIQGQLRGAWEIAREHGASRSALNVLMRHTVEVGKRVRTETGIGRGTASVSHAAVELAVDTVGSLRDRAVLVIGAGEMGERVAVALDGAGAGRVTVANRTHGRGEALADRIGASAVHLDEVPVVLAAADVVVTSTGAGEIVLDHDTVADAMALRADRPLLVIDIAVPRNVDPSVSAIAGVQLLDLDDLRSWAARGLERRAAEVAAAESIVEAEIQRYLDLAQAREVAPLVTQLHQRGEELRAAEVTRSRRKLGDLDDGQWRAVESLTRAIVAKLLHDPSVRLKADAGTPRAERNAAALRDLFDLD